MDNRVLLETLLGVETSDGDGVRLTRIIGSPQLNMIDPFLLLDCFDSEQANDYIGGFPTHPHRGFETVTYLLNGRMRHTDSAGHQGVIEPGGVQWMTAGRGIEHSEMPEQQEGVMKGFQLWVNLPASAKMCAPKYQEFPPESIPLESHDNGTAIRVIAGKTNQGTLGPVINDYTYPIYMDMSLPAGNSLQQALPSGHNAFVYVIEGSMQVMGNTSEEPSKVIGAKHLGILGKGQQLCVHSGDSAVRFLLIAGAPLNEPVARLL